MRRIKRGHVRKGLTATLYSAVVARALRRAAREARKTARMHGTPIYVLKEGKVVALDPETLDEMNPT